MTDAVFGMTLMTLLHGTVSSWMSVILAGYDGLSIVNERSQEVNFLDLTIKINDANRIETRTYQKQMNLYLYLYLHHASAHPLGVLKGMVYGCMQQYYLQNSRHSEDSDYLKMIRLPLRRLVARGHYRALLNDMMVKAVQEKIEPGQYKYNRTEEEEEV